MDLKLLLKQINQERKTVDTDKIRKLLKEEEKRIDKIRDLLWEIDIERRKKNDRQRYI